MGNNNRSVSSFVLVRHSRLRVVVMVEVRGRGRGEVPSFPKSPSSINGHLRPALA